MPFNGELRPFQRDAYDQLIEWGRGLLAVTMGGGKTPITIAILEHLLDTEQVECGLIVTPASLKYQWNGERGFPLFAPDARVVVIDGDADARREQYIHAAQWAEYIVLGYSQVTDDWQYVKRLPNDFIVMDEAQYIKNPGAQRTQKMQKLLRTARKRGAPIFGLTGQPLENKPEDVFHVCAGIDPTALGHPEIFDRTFIHRNKYGKPVRYSNLDVLHRRLEETIMVRVEREEIEEYLPEREFEEYVVPFDSGTLEVYATIVRDLVESLEEMQTNSSFDLAAHYTGGTDSAAARAQRGKVMGRLLCARMLCDHPNLLRLSADLFETTKVKSLAGSMKAGSAYAHELARRGALDGLPSYGPKLRETVDEIAQILDADPANKVVLFSTFKPTLTWIKHALRERTEAVLYHGGVTNKRREALKDRFNSDPDVRLFLSSDAGGAGVDLPGGNYLINYNLPFSAGKLEQRNARIDRMSSAHEQTKVISFMMEGSVEEYYADIVKQRQRTARAGIDGRGSGSVSLPSESLKGFLLDWLDAYDLARQVA